MTKKFKKLLSATSMILSFAMLSSLPVQAVSQTAANSDEEVLSSFDNVQGEAEEIGDIVAEDTAARTEYTKEFVLDDGTTMLAEYDEPVHYEDSNGNWVEYDNSLVAENSATSDEVGSEYYTNKSSDIDIKLSKETKSDDMVSVSADGCNVSWGYDDANEVNATVKNNDEEASGNDEFTALENLTSETVYENAFKNVDLQYFVTSTGIKENIILKSSDVQNEFNITYKTENLTATQTDDYTISLSDKSGNEVYTISAPYMYDADGNSSTQMKLEMLSQEDGQLKVKLTADYWFIHGIGRAFPVTIDPQLALKKSTAMKFSEIDSKGNVEESAPYYVSSDGRVVTTFSKLPFSLDNGEEIISAKFNYEISSENSLFESEDESAIIVNAHEYSGSSPADYESSVLDYDSLTYDDNGSMTFDLTELVKKWYSDENSTNGFVLEANNTVGSKTVTIDDSTKKPLFTVVYKDFTGTENSLSYHTVSVGESTQASVGNYLGNLVITQSLLEESGSRMPLSISATYNSINYDTAFSGGSPSGCGWQFSFNQSVSEISNAKLKAAGYNYVYTDSDGTDHYLKKSDDGTEWSDEDGLGITLTADDNNIYIDNGSTTQTYELTSNGGKLLSEKDEYDNAVTYAYSSGKLISITDGAGRTTSLVYGTRNDEEVLTTVTKPDGSTISIDYLLTGDDYNVIDSITSSDGTKMSFEYDDSSRLTSTTSSKNSSQICKYTFTFSDNSKVTKIAEYGSDNTVGNYLKIQYNSDNTTKFTDRQGRSETHTFDNSGATVSVLNSNGYIPASGSEGLTISGSADSYTKNYITQSTEQTELGSGKYYYQTDFSKSGTTSSGGTVSLDTSSPSEEDGYYQYLGTTSLKVNNPVSDDNSAFFTAATHRFDDTSFNGKSVTFSAFVKTKNVKQIYSGGPIGAVLQIRCYDSTGKAVKYANSVGISGTVDWQRLSVTAAIPESTSYFCVYCVVRYASGTAWFDCLQLEEGGSVNDFNALQNSDFSSNDYWLTEENNAVSAENGSVSIGGSAGAYDDSQTANGSSEDEESDTQPSTYYETVTETVPNDSVYTYDDYGNIIKTEQGFVTRTVKKTYEVEEATEENDETAEESKDSEDSSEETSDSSSDSLGNKYIYQNVKVGKAGVNFQIKGLAKADSVPLTNDNRTFGIALNIYYENCDTPETHYAEFNEYTNAQQQISLTVTPEKENYTVDYVAFAFVYGYNENTMTVSNAELNISNVYYTSEASDTANENTDSNSDTDGSDEDDDYIDYEVVSESVDTSQTYMSTSAEYDSTGNYAVTETDEAGNTTSSAYDTNGNKTSQTDGNGNTVSYSYDSSGDVTSVSSGNSENTYEYGSSGTLSTIVHNSFKYEFNYDVFSNLISTKIGDTTIASNTYSANNGHLTKTTYANGDYIQYGYDKYNNIVKITGEDGVIAGYTYDKSGRIAKAFDFASGETTYYYYDFSGSLISQYTQSDGGVLTKYSGYGSNGNQIEKTNVNGSVKTITTGTDSDGNAYTSNDGVKSETETDDFGRTTKVKTTLSNGGTAFYTEYEYADGKDENSTTNLTSKVTQTYGDDNIVTFEYSYDANGNITQIKQDGTVTAKYTYDSLNQLKEEYDYVRLEYVNFSYDNSGNVTAQHTQRIDPTYKCTTGNEYGNVFYYNDSEWKDKLTAVNSDKITYDESGNPLSYRNGMTFAWQLGRQLASTTLKDGTAVTYAYNANGMRTCKDVGGTKTYYYYDDNNNLIGMVKGDTTMFFYYDSSNSPVSVSCNGEMYYYIKNLQGDIVKIIDQSGTEVAEYKYDALGTITGSESFSDNDIAALNPLRYRGYVYDDETGLYYLQTRYYDPVTGRFLNADAYCDTQTGTTLSTNMFAYCENNAVMETDTAGTDAWWLQDSTAVYGLGHTSLLIQEKPGRWWYFYWGDKSIKLIYIGSCTLCSLNFHLRTYYQTYKNKYGRNVNEYLYDGWYNRAVILKGNFYNSLKYIYSTLLGRRGNIHTYSTFYYYGNPNYNLIYNNCMQVSVDVLRKGTFYGLWNADKYYKKVLLFARSVVVPNLAYYGLLKFDQIAKSFYGIGYAIRYYKSYFK